METKKETSQRWEDVVFEKRNKDYGAYSIRQAYSQNVNKGFMMALGSALLFFIIPMIASSFRSIDRKNDIIKNEGTIINPPPVIEKLKQIEPPKQQQRPRKVTGGQFVVTNQQVPDADIDKIDVTVVPVEGDVHGDPDIEPLVGVGTGDEPPTVVEPSKPEPPVIAIGIQADYKGGMQAMYKFLGKHLRYPATERRIGVDGTVFVSFVVNTEGKVVNATVIKGISKGCDEEAIRVISMMDGWIPAEQNNRKVMVRMVLPIKFHLDV